jgi:hypothetical protein
MRLRTIVALGLALALLWAGQDGARAADAGRMVKTWVPPYAIAASQERLEERYGGVGPADGLTHLGLQFWVPSQAGGLERSSRYGTIGDAQIAGFVTWGKASGVKVMLTVYNGEWGWDWALAKNAFGANRTAFADALVAEMQARGLDGIDIDLEGAGMDPTAEEKAEYVAFIKALNKRLRPLGKELVLDSFSYVWNAPNTTWWPELLPLVDGLVSMGYQEIGRGAPDWQSYAWQRKAAGKHADKLLLGMPSDRELWLGKTVVQQIAWVLPADRKVGIAIWDAQNPSAAWRTRAVWKRLKAMREQ